LSTDLNKHTIALNSPDVTALCIKAYASSSLLSNSGRAIRCLAFTTASNREPHDCTQFANGDTHNASLSRR